MNGHGIQNGFKSVCTWFGNYAGGNAKEVRPAIDKSDTRGHPTSSKAWTTKLVCSHIHMDRISKEQKSLSEAGEKDIGKYCAALFNVFKALSEHELKQCENLAVEWNTKTLPDAMQLKYVAYTSHDCRLIRYTCTDFPKIF